MSRPATCRLQTPCSRWSTRRSGASNQIATAKIRRSIRRLPGCRASCSASASSAPAGASTAPATSTTNSRIMSVSKPFLFALVCETIGPEEARAKLGANATGLPFNSLAAIEQGSGRTNPMVNAGAIATTSLVPGATAAARWHFIHDGLSRFAGRTAAAQRRGLCVGVADQFSQPQHRAAAARATTASIATPRRRPISTRGSARST